MTLPKAPVDPFTVVAETLHCPRASLSAESAMYKDHGWDSFGHVSVIVALEKAYGVSISNDEVMVLTTMKAIIKFSERSREAGQHDEQQR